MPATIDRRESTATVGTLFVALELSRSTWRLAMTTGVGRAPRERVIRAGSVDAFRAELDRARQRFGLPPESMVMVCYEAGRDGFWVARWLEREGMTALVVESSSIEVPRLARRTKTDRVDARKLLSLLLRDADGDRRVWKVVQVPTEADEDQRHSARALRAVKQDRTRVINRIRGLLATQGVQVGPRAWARFDVTQVVAWNGQALASGLQQRLAWELQQLQTLTRQVRTLERQHRGHIRARHTAASAIAQQLTCLKGIGTNGAWLFATEVFSWRRIRNGRQLGALTGLAPTPYQSGTLRRDLGIAKSGNRQLRAMAVELAWGWLRFQPRSALTRWYLERFSRGHARLRRIGIVALARKLVVALWRYVDANIVPAGAELKIG